MNEPRLQVRSRKSTERCPLCLQAVREHARLCPECGTGYHQECTLELGDRCAVLGCAGQLQSKRPRREPEGFLDAFDRPTPADQPAAPRREPAFRDALARAWERFSLLHFACGVLFFGPLGAFSALRLGAETVGELVCGVGFGLMVAFLAGCYQDRFWYAWFGQSSRFRRW